MRKIVNMIFVTIIMFITSIICIGIISVLSYMYKWQADKALAGITITYILAGFTGGIIQKILDKEKKSIGQKMLGGIFTGAIFVVLLLIASNFMLQNPLVFSNRFFMILMLVIGSTCLGRIL